MFKNLSLNLHFVALYVGKSAMLRKDIVQSCDTQCTESDCDVIFIKN